MNKHTPGPWAINKDSIGDLLQGSSNIDAASHKALATVVYQMEDDEGHNDDLAGSNVCRANALLITSAPDLLEALLDMVSAMESYGYPHSPEIATARAAIAKATGESK